MCPAVMTTAFGWTTSAEWRSPAPLRSVDTTTIQRTGWSTSALTVAMDGGSWKELPLMRSSLITAAAKSKISPAAVIAAIPASTPLPPCSSCGRRWSYWKRRTVSIGIRAVTLRQSAKVPFSLLPWMEKRPAASCFDSLTHSKGWGAISKE